MKKKRLSIFTLLIGSLCLAQLALAGLKIPRTVFTMDKLVEAKAEAAEKSKPLIFVYTDPGSS